MFLSQTQSLLIFQYTFSGGEKYTSSTHNYQIEVSFEILQVFIEE